MCMQNGAHDGFQNSSLYYAHTNSGLCKNAEAYNDEIVSILNCPKLTIYIQLGLHLNTNFKRLLKGCSLMNQL